MQHDLAAEDAPGGVAPPDEGVGGVKHLLVEARRTAVAPGSAMVAILMEVSVTPGSVAPLASPGPQTALRVPKSPTPVAAAAAVVAVAPAAAVVAVALADVLDRLHPVATSTPTIDNTTPRLTARPPANIPIPPLSATCQANATSGDTVTCDTVSVSRRSDNK